jgi:inorganic pyrophosphatase
MENQYTKASDYLGKKVILTIDRQFSTKHPKHEFMYELNYGFVPNTLSPDGEELDGYYLSSKTPLQEYRLHTTRKRCHLRCSFGSNKVILNEYDFPKRKFFFQFLFIAKF